MRNRKKKNGEQRRINLSSLILSCEQISRESLENSYHDASPFRLEIGCGKGDFITGLSKKEPGYNYVAVERIGDVCLLATEKYAQDRGLGTLSDHGEWIAPDGRKFSGEPWDIPLEARGNVRFFIGPAEALLPYLPDCFFEGIYTNFSDPWPKKGYASRRLTNPSYLREYARILRPGGKLNLKTDNDSLFEYSVESLTGEGWDIVYKTVDLHSEDAGTPFLAENVMTEYEKRFVDEGVKIKALVALAPDNSSV